MTGGWGTKTSRRVEEIENQEELEREKQVAEGNTAAQQRVCRWRERNKTQHKKKSALVSFHLGAVGDQHKKKFSKKILFANLRKCQDTCVFALKRTASHPHTHNRPSSPPFPPLPSKPSPSFFALSRLTACAPRWRTPR